MSVELEAEESFAEVAVPVPVRRLFTYRVGQALRSSLFPGVRVRVPFGGRRVVGTVVQWPADRPQHDLEVKPIESVLPGSRRLSAPLLELTRFVADYYLCSWGEAIEAALPPEPAAQARERIVRRSPVADAGRISSRARLQQRAFDALPQDGSFLSVAALPTELQRALPALSRAGCIERSDRERATQRASAVEAAPAEAGPSLTPGQAAVLARITPTLHGREFRPYLLFGATGSGKTEVYFRAAAEVLARGRDVLYLVPEIGLTPLLLTKITRRFPGQVAVLHSALARGARHASWTDVATGLRRLVVGTRSAVFAPLGDPGLIVIDEEQDGSYKQEETPRYNGRDLAIVRGRAADCVVLLGSATPSVESFHHAASGRYELLRLGGRVEERPLPAVRFVDMRLEYRRAGEVSPLSAELTQALVACVARGEQALVLRNRRGWAAAVLCPTCGNRVSCLRCSVSMTWHRSESRLRCHYCGSEERFPPSCPTCGAEELKLVGEGTERIEDRICEAVPGARVERMDRDSVRRRGAHEKLLRRFDRGEIDILVGTQMIAKGHDFPRVTLVGVISADQSLGLPDFRAGERVFQLLTQVAGRAGRGERPGEVLIQAFDPDHPLLRHAARQDYEAFYAAEIRYRQALRYPPISGLVQLRVLDRQEHKARAWAETLAEAIERAGKGKLLIGGPGPAPIERIKGRFRQQILVRSAGRRRLIETIEQALSDVEGRVPRRAVQVDVDPYSLL